MVTYIMLAQFTDQGIRSIKNSPQRASQVAEIAQGLGCQMKEVFWTLGKYDVVLVVDAPDDQTFTTFGLALGSAGNVRTQSLRAFTKNELASMIKKMP